MLKLIVTRVAVIIPTLFFVVSIAFFLSQASSVDPADFIAGGQATQEQVDEVRRELGLDEPVIQRYGAWLGAAVTGDLGESVYTGVPVTDTLKSRLPVTLSLTFGALLIALIVGVPTGVYAALRAGRPSDRVASAVVTIGQAIPSFWLGLLLAFYLGVKAGWFPAVGYTGPTESVGGWIKSITLPSVALGLAAAAAFARQTRSALIGVLQQEYIRTALAKGLPKRVVIVKHALRNAAVPLVTVVAFQTAALLGGAVIVEQVFALPGLGTMAIDAILRKDPNVVQGFVVITVIVVVFVNLLLDLAYAWLNPKVRRS